MKMCLKVLSLFVGLLGLTIQLLDLTGYLIDKEKVDLAARLEQSERVERTALGFEKLLARFPPGAGVDSQSVTAAATYRLQTAEGFNVYGKVAYVAGGSLTPAVATFEEIRSWSRQSNYGWYSWIVLVIGWGLLSAIEIHDFLNASRASA
jgi:hypothetical protein